MNWSDVIAIILWSVLVATITFSIVTDINDKGDKP